MAIRHYPAIIEGDAETGYSVFFPDLPGCTSGGQTLQEAALHVEDALAGHLALMLEGGGTAGTERAGCLAAAGRTRRSRSRPPAGARQRAGGRAGMSTRTDQLYADDFYAWTQRQAKELRRFARSRPNVPLDLEHIAKEIGDLGTERRSRVRTWARRIIEDLLLLEHSPARAPRRGWMVETVNFRRKLSDHMSGALRRDLKRKLPRLYDEARTCRRSWPPTARRTSRSASPSAARTPLDQIFGDF